MEDNFFSLPVSLLRQHCFCPRIPYFIEVLGIKPVEPLWVNEGSKFHEIKSKAMQYRPIKALLEENYQLLIKPKFFSRELGIHGELDILMINEKSVIPVELKHKYSSLYRGNKVQLVAYGLLASYFYTVPVAKALFLFDNPIKTKEVYVSKEMVVEVEKVIEETKKVIYGAVMPSTSATTRQCCQCEYSAFCDDR